jgi:hypothetical protein
MTTIYAAWPTGQHDEIRARIAAHRDVDEIVQSMGWDGHHGCAIGCSMNRYSHVEYSRVLGIPLMVAYLVDELHEGLSLELALDWPGRVAAALRPGADTTHVWTRFVIWILREECPSVTGEGVAALYERRLAGDEPQQEKWTQAEAATWKEWARRGRGARVARAAVEAATWAKATCAATEAVTWEVIRAEETAQEACYQRMADALIEILLSCPGP